MTSKNLFLKLQREDMKRRVWSIALSMLSFFLLFTVVCAMEVSNYAYRIEIVGKFDPNVKEWIHEQIISFIGPANELVLMITMVCAVICGLSGFFYLHSKKKVDLFHSIPVRREKLFAATFINGLLIYIIPYLIIYISSLFRYLYIHFSYLFVIYKLILFIYSALLACLIIVL